MAMSPSHVAGVTDLLIEASKLSVSDRSLIGRKQSVNGWGERQICLFRSQQGPKECTGRPTKVFDDSTTTPKRIHGRMVSKTNSTETRLESNLAR